MRGAALQTLRYPFDLDRGPVGNQNAGKGSGASFNCGRTRNSAAKPDAGEGAGFGLYTEARISGGSGGLRGFVKGWVEFSKPERVSGGIARRGSGAVYARERSDFCADTDCVFASHSSGRFVQARCGLHSAAK